MRKKINCFNVYEIYSRSSQGREFPFKIYSSCVIKIVWYLIIAQSSIIVKSKASLYRFSFFECEIQL